LEKQETLRHGVRNALCENRTWIFKAISISCVHLFHSDSFIQSDGLQMQMQLAMQASPKAQISFIITCTCIPKTKLYMAIQYFEMK